jgi:homoserine kinase
MCGIGFDANGASMDRIITLDQMRTTIKALKYMISKNEVEHDSNKTLELISVLEQIEKQTAAQNNRRIHVVVVEPVEYDYPD